MMNAEERAAFLDERCGCLTASSMWRVVARKQPKKGQEIGDYTAERQKYMLELLAERETGITTRHVVTEAMQDGIDYEDEAADAFVELTGRSLKRSHTYTHPELQLWKATPDRELEDGLVEIKVPTAHTFIEWKLAGGVPEKHVPQMLSQCAVTGKRWVGFVAYSPRIKEPRRRLFTAKFVPTQEQLDMITAEARKFLDETEQLWELLTTGTAA